MRTLIATALVAATAGVALAHHDGDIFRKGDMVVSHAYTFENAKMAHSMRVYLTLANAGAAADRLVSASVPFAGRVLFEGQAIGTDGTLSVREIAAVAVEPGQTITFQPGALWIELESVSATFEHGEHFDMTLVFERAGAIEIEVEVEEADEHGDDDHGKPAS